MIPTWECYKIADLLSEKILFVGDGYRAKNEELGPLGLPFARAGNVNGDFNFKEADRFPEDNLERVGNKVSKPNDVVFTSKGTVGRIAFVRLDTPRFVYSPQLCFWRVLDENIIYQKFLYFWMLGKEFYLQYSAAKGQTDMADYVNLQDQRRMKITLPPLPDQRAIARILGSLDDKIELNRHMNETLEAIARAIFKSWFVDFDPVHAKAEGREPAGMDAETAALFPDSFEVSTLGEIPKGWSVGSILKQAQLISGGTPKTSRSSYWGGNIPWASAKDVSQCGECFLISTERTITPLGLNESSTKMIEAFSSVIVARGATTGRLSMLGTTMAMNQTCYALRSYFGSHFALYCQLNYIIKDLINSAHGSVFDTITTDTFKTHLTLLPPEELICRFEVVAYPFFQLIWSQQNESRTLATIRDLLLPKLLSGKIRVELSKERLWEQIEDD